MKKNNQKQSNSIQSKNNNKITDCDRNTNNVKNSKVNNKANNIGFEDENHSFKLDENDDHSFNLR